jgi:hypothetical protein
MKRRGAETWWRRLGGGLGSVCLALCLGAPPARAADAGLDPSPLDASPLAARSLAARGPLALSAAAEPGSLHWAFETGVPLGLARRDASGRAAPVLSPWRLDGFVNAVHDREDARTIAGVGYALRLERARDRSAAWLGLSRGGARAAGDPEAQLRLGAGLAHAFSGVHAEVEWVTSSVLFRNDPRWSTQHTFAYAQMDSAGRSVPRDTTVSEPADHAALWNTAQGTLRWRLGRLSLATVGGVSTGDGVLARRWAQGMVEWQLTRRLLLLGSLGERPAPSLAFHSEAHPRTMIGLQFAPWSTKGWAMSGALVPTALAWKTEALPHERLVVRVHLRDVASAEIAGDFTDWKPVALERLHGGWWYQVLQVPPGVHRVQLRLDGGAWQSPPGLPRADDGPGGPSGTLVVIPAGD